MKNLKCIGIGIIQLISFLFFSNIAMTSSKLSVVLDKQSDIFRMWKLNGSYIYYPNGHLLRTIHDHFPADFDFAEFSASKGIWSVFPEAFTEQQRFSLENTSASFAYSSSAQLLDSVTLTYCMAGNSRILVKKFISDSKPLFTITPSETPAYEWVELTVHFPASSQVRWLLLSWFRIRILYCTMLALYLLL